MIVGRTAKLLTAATLALLMLLGDAASGAPGRPSPNSDRWMSGGA